MKNGERPSNLPRSDAGASATVLSPKRARQIDNSPEGKSPSRLPDGVAGEAPLREGFLLKNRYVLEKVVGEGGMGIVYRARDFEEQRIAGEEQEGQYVAIKMLRPELRAQPDSVRLLFEEVRRTRELAHPNIVSVYGCEQDGPYVFMKMQYLEGKAVDALVREDAARGLPWDRARPIIAGIGSGLGYAHDRGVTHCDLKPSNVFLTAAGVPKILDFGVAQAARRVKGDQLGLRALTLEYASPESVRAWKDQQLAEAPNVGYRPSSRDDIYSFGCLVYELLSGRHPFDGLDGEEARSRGLGCAPIPEISSRQNQAVRKALAFDAANRFIRVEDFVQALLEHKTSVPRVVTIGAGIVLLATVASGGIWYFARTNVTRLNQATSSVTPILRLREPPAPSISESTRAVRLDALAQRLGSTVQSSTRSTTQLLAALRTAPRRVVLGSTPEERAEALALCQRTSPNCDPDSYSDEVLRTAILKPYVMDDTAVTVGQFGSFVEQTHYRTLAESRGWAYGFITGALRRVEGGSWRNGVTGNGPAASDLAVVGVNFADAQSYCHWIQKRLPTEDEWEYAARGPRRQVFPYNDGSVALPVGNEQPAAADGPPEGIAGVYRGLSGGVWEWTDTAAPKSAGVRDGRVLKGGSWLETDPANRRSAARRYEQADRADSDSGFRCAHDAPEWPDVNYWLSMLK